ncbi:uncharacterized protein BKCO1_1100067 [Diplodia corticola]|uniref:Uncharacterized protein n=1 Tax=Diplodia corticola TaxID=236234 RepID=A0A1J9S7E5_9PEZI|nr:uncharacterized protein BKCO1_1100067 [Diplodia corticola]OJD36423.1 hypothetical protein BKCO1_1100067 [Diplodia corticola]
MSHRSQTEREARRMVDLQLNTLNHAYYRHLSAIPHVEESVTGGQDLFEAFLVVRATNEWHCVAYSYGLSREEAVIKLVHKLLAHEMSLRFQHRGRNSQRAPFASRPTPLCQVWLADSPKDSSEV